MATNTHEVSPSQPLLHKWCDWLTAAIIYFMAVFGPWAFGTTQPWSIQVMTVAGCALGVLLVIKWILRKFTRYHPHRWGSGGGHRRTRRRITVSLAVLTVLILAYCLTSVLNARADFNMKEIAIQYWDYIEWLPHSYDRDSSIAAFWMYLGLASAFWAMRDWMLHKTPEEQRLEGDPANRHRPGHALPARVRRLLWILSINGTLLAVEGIFQKVEGSGRLLGLVTPRIHKTADAQFGPYAYRSNAAQYFNLLWPVCLGLWWSCQAARRRPLGPTGPVVRSPRNLHHLLLPCVLLMLLCPLIANSRGGLLVGLGCLALTFVIVLLGKWNIPWPAKTGAVLGCLVVGAMAYALNGPEITKRLQKLEQGFADRERIFAAARNMAAEHRVFGTGPGTFSALYVVYRQTLADAWQAQAHNDWLETRITFGWGGSALIAGAFLMVLLKWFTPGGISADKTFVRLIWIALAGCLVHARFDFPLQIHSILFLFLTLCAVLSCLGQPRREAAMANSK